ncbi:MULTISPECIES: ATP-binding protein [Burkholderia]|uniref:ATP-binding protein n=1 Tax=Burkholderia TaxID=32008 RepID=UPI00075C08C1|nr:MULTISPECIES: ATP-binding protein [Burkholderia]AOK12089.1 histidine kinase [Burkholderia vietnamiensis]KVE20634.1 histidine kinase [Burkholderia vietnamiensis]MDN8069586.1 ATP-binding protein [Burkholderia vietnamiensis]RQM61872.1 sensor histidine kinase [Burkholderia vietnamiensis]CAG9199497.1 Sensory histidine kinase in two-component regulatory system with RstA [Burkholderia vietnamiensis]
MIRRNPSHPDAAPLSPLRYAKWRWLHFRRAWTDTRADRIPSWSRLYVRTYLHLLGLVLLTALVPGLALCVVLSPQVVWHAFDALPGDIWIVLAFMLAAPALAAYRWMRPVWSDLVMVRERAIDFTGGRFNTRARESHSVIIGPLARTLNALAMRMERLIAAQRDLTNGISHELRTPLARVRFALEMLREPGSAAEYYGALDSIAQDVTELEELIDMSLTYARLEYSSLQSNLELTAPVAWFEHQISDAQLLYPERAIESRIAIASDLRVKMDRRLMSYAMRNLLRNASKYANARIVVGIALEHGNIAIFVEDDGPGVPESERERIFDAFVRLDRRTGGYGLGLAITRQVLHAHNGRIAVVDPVVLGGARFEISWPI